MPDPETPTTPESMADSLFSDGDSTAVAEPETTTSESAPEPSDTQKPDETTEPDETTAGDEDGDDTQDGASDDSAWIKEMSERYSVDLSKYKTREDAEGGLFEAMKTVGRASREAAFGRQVWDAVGDRWEEFLEFAQGRTTRPAEPAGAGKEDFSRIGPQELRQIIDEGQADGALPTDKKRATAAQAFVWERLMNLAVNPGETLKQHGIDPEAQKNELQQAMAYQQSARERQEWIDRHAKDIWREGVKEKGLTPLGVEAERIFQDMAEAGVPDSPKAWDKAMKYARQLMPKPKTRTNTNQAQHRAAVAVTTPAKKSYAAKFHPEMSDDEKMRIVIDDMTNTLFPDGD